MESAAGQFKGQVSEDFASASVAHADVVEANRGHFGAIGWGVVGHGGAVSLVHGAWKASVHEDWPQGAFESRP